MQEPRAPLPPQDQVFPGDAGGSLFWPRPSAAELRHLSGVRLTVKPPGRPPSSFYKKAQVVRTQEREEENRDQLAHQQCPHLSSEEFPTASEPSLLKPWVYIHIQHSLSCVPSPGCHPCKKGILYPFHLGVYRGPEKLSLE